MKTALVWLVAVSCCATWAPADEPAPLRVMSFNIRYGRANDGDNHWERRKELVIDTIRRFDPDVLGTQEMMDLQADYFRERLPGYAYHGTSRIPTDPTEEQSAVFYRESRFELASAGHFWLSRTPDKPGSRSWESAFPRMVSWVELRERAPSAGSFFVFNTHFDHRSHEARLQGAAVLRSRIQAIAGDAPVVVMGDFNSDQGSVPHRVLIEPTEQLTLVDSYRAAHPEPDPRGESTSTHWNGNRRGRRIDWVLHSPGWRATEAEIDRTNDNGRYPSDHYPVTAVLELRGEPQEKN